MEMLLLYIMEVRPFLLIANTIIILTKNTVLVKRYIIAHITGWVIGEQIQQLETMFSTLIIKEPHPIQSHRMDISTSLI